MITQKVRVLNNTASTILFKASNLFYDLDLYELTTLPAWITVNYFGLVVNYLTLNPTTTGTYTYYFTLGGSPSEEDACLIIEVVDSLVDLDESGCGSTSDKCIVWITREGGRASYNFNQRKDYGGVLGQSQTFDNGGIIKYLTRGKNFQTVTIYKTGISDDEVDLIESLRYSIQAWEYDPDTDISTPIVLDGDSYDKYSTKKKLSEVKLRYRIGQYKEVQSQ